MFGLDRVTMALPCGCVAQARHADECEVSLLSPSATSPLASVSQTNLASLTLQHRTIALHSLAA